MVFSKKKSSYMDWSDFISSSFPQVELSADNIQIFTNFMVIIAVLGVFPLVFQTYKIYSTKETEGVSATAFSFEIFISLMWGVFGFMTHNGVIIISSILMVITASLLVFFTWKYGDDVEDGKENAIVDNK